MLSQAMCAEAIENWEQNLEEDEFICLQQTKKRWQQKQKEETDWLFEFMSCNDYRREARSMALTAYIFMMSICATDYIWFRLVQLPNYAFADRDINRNLENLKTGLAFLQPQNLNVTNITDGSDGSVLIPSVKLFNLGHNTLSTATTSKIFKNAYFEIELGDTTISKVAANLSKGTNVLLVPYSSSHRVELAKVQQTNHNPDMKGVGMLLFGSDGLFDPFN